MNEIRNCSECGKQFERGPRSITCSHECGTTRNVRLNAVRLRAKAGPAKPKKLSPPPSMVERACVVCAAPFVGREKRVFCSYRCRYRGRPGFVARKNSEKPARVVYHRSCPECGTEFSTGMNRKLTCSMPCRMAIRNRKNRVPAERQKPRGVGSVKLVTCTECGLTVETTCTKPKVTCSKLCSDRRMQRLSREAKSMPR